MIASGLGLLLLGLLAWLVGEHIKSLRFYDRPASARSRLFDPALAWVAWVSIAAGLLQLGRGSVRLLACTGLVLLLLWSYRRFVRSASFQRRLLRRDLDSLRRDRPGVKEEVLLCQLVYRRHPAWGEELIEQMVRDYPGVPELARVLARMEKGFRGFRP